VAVAGFLLLALLRTKIRYLGAGIAALATVLVVVAPSEPPPDMVIAEDGNLVAIVRGQVLAPNRPHPPDFIFDQWRRALAAELDQPPQLLEGVNAIRRRDSQGRSERLSAVELRNARDALRQAATSAEDRFVCLKGAWCTATHDSGYVVTIVENPAYFGAAGDTADIVVTLARLRTTGCRSGALLFTGETLRRFGAAEVRIDDQGSPVVTTAYTRPDRPWIRHRAYNWRSGTFDGEPLAFNDSGE